MLAQLFTGLGVFQDYRYADIRVLSFSKPRIAAARSNKEYVLYEFCRFIGENILTMTMYYFSISMFTRPTTDLAIITW